MRRITLGAVLVLAAGLLFGAVPARAESALVQKARTALAEAQAKQTAAGAALEAAQDSYDQSAEGWEQGAPGFYRWIVSTYQGTSEQWKADDASKALSLYANSSFKSYTHEGEDGDASDLENLQNSLDLFAALSAVRASDEYHPNLPPVYTNSVLMARAQVNANASAATMNHMGEDAGAPGTSYAENLAWGYPTSEITARHSAFSGWYYEEKLDYTELVHYVEDHFPNGLRYGTEAFENYLNLPDTDGSKANDINAYEQFRRENIGVIGHYTNTCAGIYRVTDYSDPVEWQGVTYGKIHFERADYVTAGFGIASETNCTSMEIDGFGTETARYTPQEYISLFRRYYDAVNPEAELAKLNAAQQAYDAAERAVQEAQEALEIAQFEGKFTVTLSRTSYTYTGKKLRPKVTVKMGEKTVTSDHYSLSWKGDKAMGTATVTVKGKGAYSEALLAQASYTIRPPKGKIRSVKRTKKKLTVKWQKVSAAWGYTVQIADNKQFAGAKTVTVKGAKKTSYVLKKPKKKKKYYVRVNVLAKSGGAALAGNWSKTAKK